MGVKSIGYIMRAKEAEALEIILGIQRIVSHYFNLPIGVMTDPQRGKEVVLARQIAMYLSRDIYGYSYPMIGLAFNRDHSTIIHAQWKIKQNTKSLQDINQLKEKIILTYGEFQ